MPDVLIKTFKKLLKVRAFDVGVSAADGYFPPPGVDLMGMLTIIHFLFVQKGIFLPTASFAPLGRHRCENGADPSGNGRRS